MHSHASQPLSGNMCRLSQIGLKSRFSYPEHFIDLEHFTDAYEVLNSNKVICKHIDLYVEYITIAIDTY